MSNESPFDAMGAFELYTPKTRLMHSDSWGYFPGSLLPEDGNSDSMTIRPYAKMKYEVEAQMNRFIRIIHARHPDLQKERSKRGEESTALSNGGRCKEMLNKVLDDYVARKQEHLAEFLGPNWKNLLALIFIFPAAAKDPYSERFKAAIKFLERHTPPEEWYTEPAYIDENWSSGEAQARAGSEVKASIPSSAAARQLPHASHATGVGHSFGSNSAQNMMLSRASSTRGSRRNSFESGADVIDVVPSASRTSGFASGSQDLRRPSSRGSDRTGSPRPGGTRATSHSRFYKEQTAPPSMIDRSSSGISHVSRASSRPVSMVSRSSKDLDWLRGEPDKPHHPNDLMIDLSHHGGKNKTTGLRSTLKAAFKRDKFGNETKK